MTDMNDDMKDEKAAGGIQGGAPGLEEHRGGTEDREAERDAQAQKEFEEIVLDADGEKEEKIPEYENLE